MYENSIKKKNPQGVQHIP